MIAGELLKLARDPDAKVEGTRADASRSKPRTPDATPRRKQMLKILIGTMILAGAVTAFLLVNAISTHLSNEQSRRTATVQEARHHFRSLIDQAYLYIQRNEEGSRSRLQQAEKLIAQHPEHFRPSDRGQLDLAQAWYFEALDRPGSLTERLARTYNQKAIIQLQKALRENTQDRSHAGLTRSKNGLEAATPESRYLLGALLMQQRLASGNSAQTKNATDQLLEFGEQYQIDDPDRMRLFRRACVRLIATNAAREHDEQSTKQLTQRYLHCLARQGATSELIAREKVQLGDQLKNIYANKQKHHPN